jgi:hypothetical protein
VDVAVKNGLSRAFAAIHANVEGVDADVSGL